MVFVILLGASVFSLVFSGLGGENLAFGTMAEIVAARPTLAGLPLEDVFLELIGREGGGDR